MSGGSHCWVTSLSLGLPEPALASLSSALIPATPLRLPQPFWRFLRSNTENSALPMCSSLAPPLSPQPLSSRVPPPAPFPAPPPARHFGRPTSFLPASGPAHGPALSSPVHIHWLDFLSRPAPETFTPATGAESCLSAPSRLGRSRGKSVDCHWKGRSGGLWGGGLGPL